MTAAQKKDEPPKKPLCFVIGPIGPQNSDIRKHADFLLGAIIRHVMENPPFNYEVRRADEDTHSGMIGDKMISDILNADIVIADLSFLNANAFYELGIRHAAQKAVVHMATAGTLLPFDNISHRTIFFDCSDWHNIETTRSILANYIETTRKPDYKITNPITQANASFAIKTSENPGDSIISLLLEKIDNIESEIRRDRIINNITKHDETNIYTQNASEILKEAIKLRLLKIDNDDERLKKNENRNFYSVILGDKEKT